MPGKRLISAAIALIGSAVGMVLSAAHTKKELIDIRHENLENQRRDKNDRAEIFRTGLEEYRNTPGAILVDVREKEDYDEGHVPGAVHAQLRTVQDLPAERSTPIFLYCYRGRRSAMAAETLREAGFENVRDIGGIEWYDGETE